MTHLTHVTRAELKVRLKKSGHEILVNLVSMSEAKATTRQPSLASSDSAKSGYSDGNVSSWTQKQCADWLRNIGIPCSGIKR